VIAALAVKKRIMKTAFMAILLATLLPITSRADEFASLEDARQMADRAVAYFAEEKFAEGYGSLKPYWPLAA
jgi:hypothetical protein